MPRVFPWAIRTLRRASPGTDPALAFFTAEFLENSVQNPLEFLARNETEVVTGVESGARRPSAQDLPDVLVVPQGFYGS